MAIAIAGAFYCRCSRCRSISCACGAGVASGSRVHRGAAAAGQNSYVIELAKVWDRE